MKYVLKPLGGHAAGGGADGTSKLSAAQEEAGRLPAPAEWHPWKAADKPGSREKAVRTLAPGTWGGNDVRQSWHTEVGSFSRPGPGRRPEMVPHTVMWPTAGRAFKAGRETCAAGQSHLDTALQQAGDSGKAALLPVPVGFPEVPRPAI